MDNLPQARLYVDGKLRAAAGNRTYDNICPWTGEVIGKAADASVEDVHEAIAGVRRHERRRLRRPRASLRAA